MVRVGVVGAMGKMGQEVVKAVCNDDTLELVCAVDVNQIDMEVCPPKSVRIIGNLKSAIEMHKPDVMVDFTQPKYVFENEGILSFFKPCRNTVVEKFFTSQCITRAPHMKTLVSQG